MSIRPATDGMTLRRSSTLFLQAIVILIGVAVLVFLLWEPHLEGRNAQSTVFQVYFADPFLAYVYAGSVAFFVALHRAFLLLGDIGRNAVFSARSVRAVRTIKFCAMTLVAFILGAQAYFFLVQRGQEDIAGGVALSLVALLLSVALAAAAAVGEKLLCSAVAWKAENDLTI